MKLPRTAQSFDSLAEWDAYWDQRNREEDFEAQAADDTCSEEDGE